MSDPKRHHYLPIFYLKQWSALDGRVIRHHRPYRQVVAHPIAPKYTGYEEGLYSLNPPAQRNVIEKTFAEPDILTCDRPLYLSHGVNDPKCVIAIPSSPRAIFLASRDTRSPGLHG